MFIGYVVPAVAVLYAFVLILRIRKESTPLDQDSGRLDPSIHRLLLASVCMQFLLWTPYYMNLLVHTVAGAPGSHSNRQQLITYLFLRCLSELLAFCSSFVIPLMYRQMNKNFSHKLQRLLKRLHCGDQSCPHERSTVQQVVTWGLVTNQTCFSLTSTYSESTEVEAAHGTWIYIVCWKEVFCSPQGVSLWNCGTSITLNFICPSMWSMGDQKETTKCCFCVSYVYSLGSWAWGNLNPSYGPFGEGGKCWTCLICYRICGIAF